MTMPPAGGEPTRRRARVRAWTLAAAILILYAITRLVFGPLPQWASYHDLADTRRWCGVERAGDVLSNIAILAAGLFGAALRGRVRVTPGERRAYRLLVASALLTALGSAWYHWAPDNTRLVFDRLPMALLVTALLALILADRIDDAFGREALVPVGFVAVGAVLLWGITEALGRGDLWLYLLMRAGLGVVVVVLLILRRGRYSGAAWLWTAVALDAGLTVAEHLDWEIWRASGGRVSGHNVKHLLAGCAVACAFVWLAVREPVSNGAEAEFDARSAAGPRTDRDPPA